MTLQELNARFARDGRVSFAEGRNGLPRLILSHPCGAKAEVYLHGAHVTSWRTPRGLDLFFISKESFFQDAKPIRGGIPVIFPQFGAGPLPQHGLARIRSWVPVETGLGRGNSTSVTLKLSDNAETRALWPHAFELTYQVILGDTHNMDNALTLALTAANTGDSPFPFKAALHTYFALQDVRRAAVLGLTGVTYVDSLRNNVREPERREEIVFERETDRIYCAGPDRVAIRDGARNAFIAIEKEGMPDYVVWNPWIDKAARMPDFGDEEWPSMLCVETGIIDAPRELKPGEKWTGRTTLRDTTTLSPLWLERRWEFKGR
jgi:glucose-6-phosphate 1-epimerase